MQAEGEVEMLPGRVHAPGDFATFFDAEQARLLKALYFVTGNREDAADLTQEAFVRLWERWDRLDRVDDPTAYLFRVALNGFRMRARAARRAAKRLVTTKGFVDPFSDVEVREDVRQMLLELTPRRRAALVLLDLYGYDSKEAARMMGIRPSTVRALATQARAVLRATGGPHA
jgi:RNA polymerase sigma factor (sigma-70 family)